MQKHIHAVLVLAIIQIVCLAAGLWIQDRLLIQTAEWTTRKNQQATGQVIREVDGRVQPTIDALLGNMSIVRFLTLIWIAGPQLVGSYLVISRLRADSSQVHAASQMELLRREKDLIRTRNAVIFGLANLAESRDRDTGQHLERIAIYSTRLAAAMRDDPRFREQISPSFVRSIGISSVLHDIGKVGILDSVLLKPGKLTDEERRHMQTHATIGGECIKQIERRLGNSNFLRMAREIALYHHERWDGEGYPHRIAGAAIPLAARIAAVADIYDALSVKRVYKDAFPHQKCVDIIRSEAGKHLDPDIVDVFLKIEHEFESVAKQFQATDALDVPEASTRATGSPTKRAGQDKLVRAVLDLDQPAEGVLAASS